MPWPELPDSHEDWASRFRDARPLIQAGELHLMDGQLRTGGPTMVIANEIVVEGKHTTGGQSVALVARKIVFQPGASIDASAADGLSYPPDDQSTNPQPGGHGSDGGRGGDGGEAGWVWLSAFEIEGEVRVTSRGGAGGRGENGQNGGRGQDGAYQGEKGARGNPGSNGGNGSGGGNGGDGGAGGHVLIFAPVPQGDCLVDTAGGQPGGPGVNGSPGVKGSGSAGGPAWDEFEGGGGANPRRP